MSTVEPSGEQEVADAARPTRARGDFTLAESGLTGGALILLIALLYVLRDFLNPIILGVAIAIVLWPYRRNPVARGLLLAGGFLLGLWLFARLSGILTPFALAYLMAYLLNPTLLAAEERWRIPRWLGALTLTIVATGAVVLTIVLIIPAIVSELEKLATNLFYAMSGFRDYLVASPILQRLESAGVIDRSLLIDNLTDLVQEQATALANSIPEGFQRVVRSISSLIQIFTISAITPVVFYYTLKDYTTISSRVADIFPRVRGSRDYLVVAGGVIGNYLRGQLTICAIAAVVVSVALTIFDVPFALLIGLLAGILNLIPNIGIIITQIVGISLALIFGEPGLVKALIVFLVLLGESLFEQSVLTPKIQTRQVGLHPVLIMMSLFVFGSLMGFVGLLIAVPATALLVIAWSAWRDELTLNLGPPKTRRPFDRIRDWRWRPSSQPPPRSVEDSHPDSPDQTVADPGSDT
jgi:predicted PurR-regulated permease PerM